MIRVLVVDDSATARLALRHGLERDPDILVVGEAAGGAQALAEIARLDPDLVTLDALLAEESGLDVAARIIDRHPLPILVVSATHTTDPTLPFRALQVGAIEATGKLPPRDDRTYPERASQLARLAKAVASTPILHRRRSPQVPEGPPTTRATQTSPSPPAPRAPRTELVLIGGSTGGPPVVAQLLRAIPVPSPVPILVAQHIASGFAASFAAWLADTTGHRTVVHGDHSPLRSGVVHVAADDHHLELTSRHLLAAISGREGACCPSIDLLFGSAALHWGPSATALLLSGMGRDGAAGLAQLHRAGAQLVVQDPASCVVDSIPTSALATGAVAMVLDPTRAAAWLARREWPEARRIEPTSSRVASPARPRRG